MTGRQRRTVAVGADGQNGAACQAIPGESPADAETLEAVQTAYLRRRGECGWQFPADCLPSGDTSTPTGKARELSRVARRGIAPSRREAVPDSAENMLPSHSRPRAPVQGKFPVADSGELAMESGSNLILAGSPHAMISVPVR